jgi:hypothetical protein
MASEPVSTDDGRELERKVRREILASAIHDMTPAELLVFVQSNERSTEKFLRALVEAGVVKVKGKTP